MVECRPLIQIKGHWFESRMRVLPLEFFHSDGASYVYVSNKYTWLIYAESLFCNRCKIRKLARLSVDGTIRIDFRFHKVFVGEIGNHAGNARDTMYEKYP